MSGYTKLFSRILDSTIWREPNETRLLWITMLAMADQDGVVHCTIPGLADRARISLQECEAALHKFQQPDKYSWSKEMEGRRITEVDGGWFLVNHAKYRALMCREEQQEKTRIRVARHRAAKKAAAARVTGVTGNACNDKHTHLPEAGLKPTPLTPLPPKSVGITVRDRRRLNEEIWRLMDKNCSMPFEEALQTACAELLLPLDEAKQIVSEAGLKDALR